LLVLNKENFFLAIPFVTSVLKISVMVMLACSLVHTVQNRQNIPPSFAGHCLSVAVRVGDI
jgi:hypothetical protein